MPVEVGVGLGDRDLRMSYVVPDVRYCSPRIILGQEEVVSEVKPVYRRAVLGAPARLV